MGKWLVLSPRRHTEVYLCKRMSGGVEYKIVMDGNRKYLKLYLQGNSIAYTKSYTK